jgi:hypothetical protein
MANRGNCDRLFHSVCHSSDRHLLPVLPQENALQLLLVL